MAIGTLLTVASIGLKIFGALSGAKSKRKQAAESRKVAEYNADQLDIDAKRVRNKALQDDQDLRLRFAGVKSSQRARLAANGVFVDSGTASTIQRDTDFMKELGSYRIRTAAEEQARTLEERAEQNRESGQAIFEAGQNAATGQLIAGAGQVAATWYNYSAKT